MRAIKSGLVALALAVSPVTLAGCATVGTIEDVQPQNAREALVQAELLTIGTAEYASAAYERGAISREEATEIAFTLRSVSVALDGARLAVTRDDDKRVLYLVRDVLNMLAPVRTKLAEIESNE